MGAPALFYGLVSAVLAAILCYFRHYLGGPGLPVFIIYWLQLVVLLAIVALSGRTYLLWFMVALGSTLLLAAFLSPAVWVILPLGFGCLWLLAVRLQRPPGFSIIGFMAAIPLSLLYFLAINGEGSANVLLPERVLTGLALPDTLFHTALSSILSHYGVLASALDGFAPIRYHAFSHLWFGLIARAQGLNAVHGYYLGLQIIVLPLLLFGFSLAVSAIGEARREPALLLVAPLLVLACFERFDFDSHLVSESHATGLALLLIGIPCLRILSEAENSSPNRSAVLALAFAILLSAAKISIGAAWTIGAVYLLLRRHRLSWMGWLASAALLLLHAWVVLKFVLPNDNVATTSWGPLDFPRHFPWIFTVNLLPVLAAVMLEVRDWRLGRDRLWRESLLLIMLVCVLPTLLLHLEGGSAYYFINVATWLALASLTSHLIGWAEPHRGRFLAAGVLAIAIISILTPEKLHAYGALKYEREAVFRRTGAPNIESFIHRPLLDPAALRALHQDIATSVGGRVAARLRQAGVAAGTDVMVAVSPSFRAFWTLTPQCGVAPFLIPAYFGVPLLDGLPPSFEHCALGTYYGFSLFGRESEAHEASDAQLCRLATGKGFHHVVILQSEMMARRLACRGLR
jgi:hypothetical protein